MRSRPGGASPAYLGRAPPRPSRPCARAGPLPLWLAAVLWLRPALRPKSNKKGVVVQFTGIEQNGFCCSVLGWSGAGSPAAGPPPFGSPSPGGSLGLCAARGWSRRRLCILSGVLWSPLAATPPAGAAAQVTGHGINAKGREGHRPTAPLPASVLNKTTIYFVQFCSQLKMRYPPGRAKHRRTEQNSRCCSKRGLPWRGHYPVPPFVEIGRRPAGARPTYSIPHHVKSDLTCPGCFASMSLSAIA